MTQTTLPGGLPVAIHPSVAPAQPRPETAAFDDHDHDLDHDHAHGHATHEASLAVKIMTLLAVLLPPIGLIAAIILLWGTAFSWVYLALFLGMYLVSGLGITVGYHRYFTHKSFDTSKPVAAILGVCGSMAVQGSLLEWAATHRSHHQHSDGDLDPHSPNTHGEGVLGVLKGMWHAHIGWFLSRKTGLYDRYVVDLAKDPMIRRVDALFPVWILLGLAIPAVLGGLLTMSWTGALLGFLWGGLARIFFVHHSTWSVNSVCHIWGSRPFRSHDESRNNAIFGILALGEGWHNNHHAFPTSARHGLRWWQFDISYIVIRTLGLLGLARNIRVPTAERMEAKRVA